MRSLYSTIASIALALFAVSFSAPAAAQQAGQQTVIIEGDIFESNIPALQPYQEDFPLSFIASVKENLDTAQQDWAPFGGKAYFDATYEISMQIFGPEQQLLYSQTLSSEGPEGEFFSDNIAFFGFDSGEEQELMMMEGAFWGLMTGGEFGFFTSEIGLGYTPFLSGPEGPQGEMVPLLIPELGSLFADTSGYPVLTTGPTFVPFDYRSSSDVGGPQIRVEEEREDIASGVALLITYGDLDSDGDGVPDLVDSCPASILDGNVVLSALDSGVSNYVGEDGCSLMDRFAACEAEAEEQPSSPWGWFQPVFSGPSQCERDVIYDAQNEQLIDYTEGRMLRNILSNND
ncbi:hypothetical protein PSI9734_01533 [Pseudidiomarina piscicola]|uniref:Uncharacterized protein n=1 Tax=Pseudidiomarina piscicola TaxID=2614830 RepID=A0A6S6WPG3_9GAMM|nr:thrombospondin type 3 repeat-containing protein [Pseudidiomarina piscicola]CAB0151119.1 hypothetical protein PSI9734_01533 [Pseudidiomarina piscicola]VZT40626.1 hypothetical protein PSI9734_01533 [Pseudomonas aeruginosa]